jgi:hypothetical protein
MKNKKVSIPTANQMFKRINKEIINELRRELEQQKFWRKQDELNAALNRAQFAESIVRQQIENDKKKNLAIDLINKSVNELLPTLKDMLTSFE